MTNTRDTVNFVAGSIIGIALGAVVGLLFAPQSGEKTRKQLKQEASKAVSKVKQTVESIEKDKLKPAYDNLKQNVDKKIENVKNEVSKTIAKASSKVKFKK